MGLSWTEIIRTVEQAEEFLLQLLSKTILVTTLIKEK